MFVPPMGLPGLKAARKSHPQTSRSSGMVQHPDQAQGFHAADVPLPDLWNPPPTFGFQQSPALAIPHSSHAGRHSGASLVISPSHRVLWDPRDDSSCIRTSVPTVLPGSFLDIQGASQSVIQSLPGWGDGASVKPLLSLLHMEAGSLKKQSIL